MLLRSRVLNPRLPCWVFKGSVNQFRGNLIAQWTEFGHHECYERQIKDSVLEAGTPISVNEGLTNGVPESVPPAVAGGSQRLRDQLSGD